MFHEMDNNEVATPFGHSLSKARETLGLSIEELSKSLNLSVNILEALEKSDVDKLPPSIYVQGYIKAYTKALGISSDEIHEKYLKLVVDEQRFELKSRSSLPHETNSDTPIIKNITRALIFLACVTLVFGIYSYYINKVDTLKSMNADAKHIAMKIPLKHEQVIIAPEVIVKEEVIPVVVERAKSVSIEKVKIKVNVEALVEASVVEEKNVSIDEISKPDSLTIRADGESWAEIRDTNEDRIYFGMLSEDDSLVLGGTAPFDIFLGNAVDIEIEVNGVIVDMSDYIRLNNIAHFKVSEKSNKIIFH